HSQRGRRRLGDSWLETAANSAKNVQAHRSRARKLGVVAARKHLLPVSVPGLRALRWSSDELYVGMKETYTITRVEAGRSPFFTRGKVWSSVPGSLRIQEPGDVVRDLSREGPTTYQIVAFPPRTVESLIGRTRIHPHPAAGDARGAAFQRLHDAVQAGANRLALEVAVAEA